MIIAVSFLSWRHMPGHWPVVLLTALLLALFPWTGLQAKTQVEVQGIGYPPIQSSSTAQALLMARRAALLDAWRHALRATHQPAGADEGQALLELVSGVVYGSRILSEEYLEDGGVRVTSMVTVADPPARQASPTARPNVSGPRQPKSVSLARWHEIIRSQVRIAPAGEQGETP